MPSPPLLAESHRFFHDLLVELRLLLVAEVEYEGKGRQTGGRLRSRKWSRSSQRERTMYGVEMDVKCGQDST